jgi:hypothetical protein
VVDRKSDILLKKPIKGGEEMDGQELLRLSVEYYKSLRKKYPYRVRWTPEFEAWQRFLEEHAEAGALDLRREVVFYSPSQEG